MNTGVSHPLFHRTLGYSLSYFSVGLTHSSGKPRGIAFNAVPQTLSVASSPHLQKYFPHSSANETDACSSCGFPYNRRAKLFGSPKWSIYYVLYPARSVTPEPPEIHLFIHSDSPHPFIYKKTTTSLTLFHACNVFISHLIAVTTLKWPAPTIFTAITQLH